MPATSPLVGFDAAAARYDADEEGNVVLAHMRARAFRELSGAFARGSRLVELGSGTGTEASRLARERGCRIALVDPSPHLLERAAGKVRGVGPSSLLGAHELPARDVHRLAATHGAASFDGAYSSFGPLNCEPSLEPVARGLALLLRPRGTVVVSIINRWCPAEVAWYALHGELREATRRWGGPVDAAAYPGGPKDVRTHYYSAREIAAAFGARFEVAHVEALPLLLPPPYLDFLVRRFGSAYRVIEPLETWAARRPLLRQLGDHVLVRLVRR
jgi:SAM-dependent methyltransferase